jgi:tetratricopeptide (TPR) repeat protein
MEPAGVLPLLPTPQGFWELVELYGWLTDVDLPAAQARAAAVADREPACVTAWLTLARLDHRRLVLDSDADPRTQDACYDHFEKALTLMPHHPQAAHHLGVFFTDTGNQRGALDVVLRAVERHPRVAHLRSALAYAARTSGLLEGAYASIRIRDELQGPSRAGRNLAENVLLYRGDWDGFRENLGEGGDPYMDPVPDFYRGYIRLIQGDQQGALRWFKAAQQRPGTKLVFEQLAQIYELALEGRRAEAYAALEALQEQRLRLRVPDGEFTFKVAEAYGYLGYGDRAMLLAERAFSQGFGCMRWFEDTPLLRGIHGHPRWRSLIQHGRDRQSLLESRFPPHRFQKR